MTANALHLNERIEHYTPPDVIEAEHDTLGGIDLDPASCAAANRWILADRIYTREDNGFLLPLDAETIHCNPPGGLCDAEGRPVIVATKTRKGCRETGACGLPIGHKHIGVTSAQKAWWFKVARAFVRSEFGSAIFVSFNVEILQNAQVGVPEEGGSPLPHPLDFTYCIPSKRIQYVSENEDGKLIPGGSPTHSSMFVLLTRDEEVRERFFYNFSSFGRVWHAARPHGR